MIRFETSRFGLLEVSEDKIIHFPEGIPGFRQIKRYILMDYKDTPLKWLQAVDEPDIAFIVVQPEYILSDYSIEIKQSVKDTLNLKDDADLVILLIIRVENGKLIANLNGPLLINSANKTGLQMIVEKT